MQVMARGISLFVLKIETFGFRKLFRPTLARLMVKQLLKCMVFLTQLFSLHRIKSGLGQGFRASDFEF
jgi:hypothetical protein